MKLEISERGNFSYYDEFLYIMSNIKKISSNNKIKVKKLTSVAFIYSAISFIFTLVFLLFYILKKDNLYFYILCFFSFIFIFSVVYFVMILNKIKQLRGEEGTIIFEITEDCVRVEKNGVECKLNWNEITSVIINKNTICFIPRELKVLVAISKDYKEQVVSILKKFKKDSLLVDNSNLYL
ncbi:MAG: hypothetical protein IKO49_08210 [Bacilli bacterium]|nr:hypothetical protein [Bacilli bacterium]